MGTHGQGRSPEGEATVTKLRPLDFVIILVAAAVVAGASVHAWSGGGSPAVVRITAAGGEYLYDLGREQRIEVEGPLGVTVVDIRDRSVRVTSSPCPQQICVQSGSITRTGQWIGCLPNRVFVVISGGEDEGIDAVSY